MNKYLTIGIAAIIGLLVGRYVLQPKQEVKIKEVVKVVKEEKNKENKKKRVVIVEKKDKDGNVTKTTEISEDTTKVSNTETKTNSTKESKTKTGHNLTLGLLAIKDASDFSRAMEYGATIGLPVLGSLSVQGLVTTDKKVGVGLSIGF